MARLATPPRVPTSTWSRRTAATTPISTWPRRTYSVCLMWHLSKSSSSSTQSSRGIAGVCSKYSFVSMSVTCIEASRSIREAT
eukprot:2516156-Prymnesium_polylepis.2